MIPFLILAVAKADWPNFRVNEAQLAFQMPSKPTRKQALFHNAPEIFYTADSPEGRFVAGYTLFPPQIRGTMHKQIAADPGASGIRSILSMTVNEFAKGGGAKIVNPQFGLDLGLPMEFATLKNGKAQLLIRVYLGSTATYTFITSSTSPASDHFFDSIRVPAEVK